MISRLANIKHRLATWREWELNPVVVKELRQAVRSWAVTGTLLLFLAVLFCTALIYLVTAGIEQGIEQELGGSIFSAFIVILAGGSLIFIPLYIGVRVAVERQESNLDLLYITTLTPARIIRGKLYCGAYVAVLFFSACMPFMAFTNLLRGIDLPTIFFILFCLFLAVCGMVQAAIFLACLPITKIFKVLMGLFGAIFLFFTIGPALFFSSYFMRSGIGAGMSDPEFWVGFASALAIYLAFVLLFYFLSVALISPPSSNRALPVRAYVTVLWLLGFLMALFWVWKDGHAEVILVWSIASFWMLVGALVVVVSNYDQLSIRVRRTIPVHPLKRSIAFLFYNGAAGGLLWAALLMFTTYVLTMMVMEWKGSPADDERMKFAMTVGAVALYTFAYALTALRLHRWLWPRRHPRIAGVLSILLPAAWALIPSIAFFFLNRLSWSSLERTQLGNVFNVGMVKDFDQQLAHFIFAAGWLVIMMMLSARWFKRQVEHFRPPGPAYEGAEPPVISAVPPALPAEAPGP